VCVLPSVMMQCTTLYREHHPLLRCCTCAVSFCGADTIPAKGVDATVKDVGELG